MSYCVNCGVELEPSEKYCPLCKVEVINPHKPFNDNAPRPYPDRLDIIDARLNRRFVAIILTIILALPAALTVSINYIYRGEAGWSLYVASSMVLIWFCSVPLFLWKKNGFIRVLLTDVGALLLYLFFLEQLHPAGNWFIRLALPLVLAISLPVLLIGFLIRLKILRDYYIAAAIFGLAAPVIFFIEYISEMYAYGKVRYEWSFYVAIPALAIGAFCIAVARRRSWRERLNRRIHL